MFEKPVWNRSPIDVSPVQAEAQAAGSDATNPPVAVLRCGHVPGATTDAAFNAGVTIFRNNPATTELLASWRLVMAGAARLTPAAAISTRDASMMHSRTITVNPRA